eukprot:TRINITY_DN3108_c0_g2_i1.p1 TRINITY_DN3108_c0_g2~~TRINITY_DN3108_c0_g2_i1.p1  ORF type:complete len:151 (+),score=33.38 TRINITY_DN3108_c0_g2_i1:75-527(+)
MLKRVPNGVSPELLATLARMGHGDEICIADGNFPSESTNRNCIRLDGQTGAQVLQNIVHFIPLDTYDNPVMVMAPVASDVHKYKDGKPPIWGVYSQIIDKEEAKHINFTELERFAFYERAKKAYAVVATSETAVYANIILKKGVVFTAGL